MKKSVLLLTLLFACCFAEAQYYYNDIVSVKASNNTYKKYKENNILSVVAKSEESDGSPTTGFVYWKKITDGASRIFTHTELEAAGTSDDIEKYSNDRLVSSQDSSDNVLTLTEYHYDNAGNIELIKTQTEDTAMGTQTVELHQWYYTGNVPDSMIRVKNNTDTTFVRFKKGQNNNISEELWVKKNRIIEHYYYYYNEKNQLTDIVRFNVKARKLLPDFMFDYNDNGTLSQLTQVPQGSSDYVIWKYVYDDRGLKINDVLFDKHQELLGTITYTYR